MLDLFSVMEHPDPIPFLRVGALAGQHNPKWEEGGFTGNRAHKKKPPKCHTN